MKKISYFLLAISFLLLSCSKDSSPAPTAPTYSVQGLWKTTSSVLNGVEIFGGTNTVKSEMYYFNTDGSFSTQSYSDTNYSTLYGSGTGTYTLPSTSTLNMSANAYSANGSYLATYNVSSEVLLLNANQLQIKVFNFPAANDVYVKKFVR